MPLSITYHTEKRLVNILLPYEKNARKISEKAMLDLKRSMQKFNVAAIPVINTDNIIISGHQRLNVARALGITEVDVRVPDRTLTAAEVRRINVRMNKNTGEWDYAVLANAFDTADLLDWGFSTMELGMEAPQLSDYADGNENGMDGDGMKQMALIYETPVFDELVSKLTAVREALYEGGNFSDIIIQLINEDYYANA